jgi:hypothetical protein
MRTSIGFAAIRNGADPHFHHGPAVGKGLNAVNGIPAATRGTLSATLIPWAE